jgi:hypothetical protein
MNEEKQRNETTEEGEAEFSHISKVRFFRPRPNNRESQGATS